MNILDRIQKKLEQNGLDAIVAMTHDNVFYTSGAYIRTILSMRDRMVFTIFPKEGEPCLIACSIEEGCTNKSWIKDIRLYTEFKDIPIKVFSDVIKEKGLEKGKIAIELDYLSYSVTTELFKELPDVEIFQAKPIFDDLRMHKTEEELKLLRNAFLKTEKIIRSSFGLLGEGINEQLCAKTLINNLLQFGGADDLAFISWSSGPENTMKAHGKPFDKKLRKGDHICLDVGGVFDGFRSDIARVAVIGNPLHQQEDLFKLLKDIFSQSVEMFKPGIRVCDIFNFVKKEFDRHEDVIFDMPHVGHSTGIWGHENPMINPYNTQELVSNGLYCLEIIVKKPGVGAFHIEDGIIVSNEGPELVSESFPATELYIVK